MCGSHGRCCHLSLCQCLTVVDSVTIQALKMANEQIEKVAAMAKEKVDKAAEITAKVAQLTSHMSGTLTSQRTSDCSKKATSVTNTTLMCQHESWWAGLGACKPHGSAWYPMAPHGDTHADTYGNMHGDTHHLTCLHAEPCADQCFFNHMQCIESKRVSRQSSSKGEGGYRESQRGSCQN